MFFNLRIAAIVGGLLILNACETVNTPAPSADGRRVLTKVEFSELPGWNQDQQSAAIPAFLRSCERLQRLPADQTLANGAAGTVGLWSDVCTKATQVDGANDLSARRFFEDNFVAFAVSDSQATDNLFTGYYEPSLRGSFTRSEQYFVPLYAKPSDTGPYPSRAEIYAGALANRDLELIYVDDAIDAFFLEVQGSGRVTLEDGQEIQVGYAGQNGHGYFPIGRELLNRGLMSREEISLQSIKKWLRENPGEAQKVMELNPSFVFFRLIDGPGPIGAQSVALTPGRSLAVDRAYHALSLPIWLDGTYPQADGQRQPLQRLMIAQDTGGAIKGVVRGDVFWGPGVEAEAIAGEMKDPGRIYWLLPRAVVVE